VYGPIKITVVNAKLVKNIVNCI